MQKTKAKVIRLPKTSTSRNTSKTTRVGDSTSTPKSLQKKRVPKKAQRESSRTKNSHLRGVPKPQPIEQPVAEPIFTSCTLLGPDGKERQAWELHVNGVLIGRAESQDSLLTYYTRLSEPLSSNHWRDNLVRRPRRRVIAQDAEKEHNAEREADSVQNPDNVDRDSDEELLAIA